MNYYPSQKHQDLSAHLSGEPPPAYPNSTWILLTLASPSGWNQDPNQL